jgi:ketosteroid isomerase-like protein
MMDHTAEIQEMVDRESRAYETYDAELMLTLFHPDMVWVWPPHSRAYDPMEWVLRMGRFDQERWRAYLQKFFDEYEIVHNTRITKKIFVSPEGDGGFAVVDIDSYWRKRDGSGDLPLSLNGSDRMAYLNLWPHARPWRLKDTVPMLLGIPDAARVGALLGDALREHLAQAQASRLGTPERLSAGISGTRGKTGLDGGLLEAA